MRVKEKETEAIGRNFELGLVVIMFPSFWESWSEGMQLAPRGNWGGRRERRWGPSVSLVSAEPAHHAVCRLELT